MKRFWLFLILAVLVVPAIAQTVYPPEAPEIAPWLLGLVGVIGGFISEFIGKNAKTMAQKYLYTLGVSAALGVLAFLFAPGGSWKDVPVVITWTFAYSEFFFKLIWSKLIESSPTLSKAYNVGAYRSYQLYK
jgi:hypothetical protein